MRDELHCDDSDASRVTDVSTRHIHAKHLLCAGDYSAALAEYVWLWRNMARLDPNKSGVRRSFLANEIRVLIDAHPAARIDFSEMRQDAGDAADCNAGANDLRLDWIVLNRVLGEDDVTIKWFDEVKGNFECHDTIRSVSRFLLKSLKDRQRWSDLGLLYSNPLEELVFQYSTVTDLPSLVREAPGASTLRQVALKRFRENVITMVVSLRAAGRHEEATAVRNEAMTLDPSSELADALSQVVK